MKKQQVSRLVAKMKKNVVLNWVSLSANHESYVEKTPVCLAY